MVDKNWWKYIKEQKERYKKLGQVECPAFSSEEIYFNYYGLNHLMYKDGVLRSRNEIIERFKYLIYVPKILKETKNVFNEEKRIKDTSIAYFWTIKSNISNTGIRIIIRRLNNGTLHFFSIMDE